ncbi:MAG: glutathione S-transferase family protein [Rhodobacteraceae bacterium]|nr:glutathione S-transferase family protein [Paracoccaceae bacterium]
MAVTLYGYRYSVYTRIARMALTAREVDYTTTEVNPFADPPDQTLTKITPFHCVPVLDHDGFTLFETSAITRYVATRFPGPALIPTGAKSAARMAQVIAIIDAHGYWPLVRQVFSHSVFRPLVGQPGDADQIAQGLKAARPVLKSLETIAAEGLVLAPGHPTLADLHLAPMIAYFAMAKDGQVMLGRYPCLRQWWQEMSQHPALIATDPGLATLTPEE